MRGCLLRCSGHLVVLTHTLDARLFLLATQGVAAALSFSCVVWLEVREHAYHVERSLRVVKGQKQRTTVVIVGVVVRCFECGMFA